MSRAFAARDLRRNVYAGYGRANSPAAATPPKWEQERNYLARSASDWRPSAVAALRGIRTECAVANWDGDGAAAVSEQVISIAGMVLGVLFDLLPKGTTMPDVLPEPDGEIGISWIIDASRMFSLSIGGHGKLNFAGQFGTEGSIHAWQPVDASSRENLERSLQDVIRYVERLFTRSLEGRPTRRGDQPFRA